MLLGGKMKRAFFCCLRGGNCTVDVTTRKKGCEVVDDKDNDVASSARVLHSLHFAAVVLNVCLLSEGVCWSTSSLCSCLSLS